MGLSGEIITKMLIVTRWVKTRLLIPSSHTGEIKRTTKRQYHCIQNLLVFITNIGKTKDHELINVPCVQYYAPLHQKHLLNRLHGAH